MRTECEHEAEVLSAVLQSRWPERASAELRAHVPDCRICSDVVAIAAMFDESREDLRLSARLPDSGRVWWQSRIRARQEAAEAAGRPIVAVQTVAFVCAVVLLATYCSAAFAQIDWRALFLEHAFVTTGTLAAIVLIPTALYLALTRD